MHYIHIPPPIAMLTLAGLPFKDEQDSPVVCTFGDFLFGKGQFVPGRLTDPKFEGLAGMIAVVEIKRCYDALAASGALLAGGAVLALENDHWQKLKEVTEKPSPSTAYAPVIMHNLLPFMKAVTEATEKAPSVADAPRDNGQGASVQAAGYEG